MNDTVHELLKEKAEGFATAGAMLQKLLVAWEDGRAEIAILKQEISILRAHFEEVVRARDSYRDNYSACLEREKELLARLEAWTRLENL